MASDGVAGPLSSSSSMRLGPTWRKDGDGYFNTPKRVGIEEQQQEKNESCPVQVSSTAENHNTLQDKTNRRGENELDEERGKNEFKIVLSAMEIMSGRHEETRPVSEIEAIVDTTHNLVSISPLPPVTLTPIDQAEVSRLWNLGSRGVSNNTRPGRTRSESDRPGGNKEVDCFRESRDSNSDDLWDDPLPAGNSSNIFDDTFGSDGMMGLNLEDMAAQSGKFKMEMDRMAERVAKVKMHEDQEEADRRARVGVCESNSPSENGNNNTNVSILDVQPLFLSDIEGTPKRVPSPPSKLESTQTLIPTLPENITNGLALETAEQPPQPSESNGISAHVPKKSYAPPPIDVALPIDTKLLNEGQQSSKNSATRDEILSSLGLFSPTASQQPAVLDAHARIVLEQQRRIQVQEASEKEQRRKLQIRQQVFSLQQRHNQQQQHIEHQLQGELDNQVSAETQRRVLQKHQQQQIQQQQFRFQQVISRGASAEPWHYLDPQGSIQGPFSSHDMREWFNAGYFNENLLIRQGTVGDFHPLSRMFPSAAHAFAVSTSAERELSRLEKLKSEYIKHESQRQEQLRLGQHRLDQMRQEQIRLAHAQAEELRVFKEAYTRQEALKMEQMRAEQEEYKQLMYARLRQEQDQKVAINPTALPPSPWAGLRSPSSIWATDKTFETGVNMISSDGKLTNRFSHPLSTRHASPPNVPFGFQDSVATRVPNSSPTNLSKKPPTRGVTTGSTWAQGTPSSGGMPREMAAWAQVELQKVGRGAQEIPLLDFCMNVADPAEVREVFAKYLGSSVQVSDFATNFIHHRAALKGGWGN